LKLALASFLINQQDDLIIFLIILINYMEPTT